MPLNADLKPVKFSQEPDISSQECQRLLSTSWSQFDKNPKMTQKLFVKYVTQCTFWIMNPLHNLSMCMCIGI